MIFAVQYLGIAHLIMFLFKDLALVGGKFVDNCDFIECKFSNIQPGFSMKDCNVGGLIITQESF